MLKTHMAACLVATAFVTAPALAQTNPATNPPAAATQMPATATMKPNMTAAQFVDQAANSNMFEIQSSQVALDKTQDNRIRDFAQRMVKDHTQAGDKLKAAAQGLTVPTTLDQEHARMLTQLEQASGNDFDRQYVQMQLNGHQKAVALFETYAQNGDNAQLKQFAQQTVPTLRDHLQMITQIHNDMSGSSRVSQNQTGPAAQAGQQATQVMTQEQPGVWRASKLKGLNVYNGANEKIGDINEILVDRQGKVEAVVIGVGGFLGIGEHDVAVPFETLQWSMTAPGNANAANRPATGSTAANTAAPMSSTAGATSTAETTGTVSGTNRAAANANRDYPDHAVLPNATKEQLKNMPEFKFNR